MIKAIQFGELNQVAKQCTTAATEYDAVNVCIKPVQYTWAARSAFASYKRPAFASYKRPAFAYVIIFTFDRF